LSSQEGVVVHKKLMEIDEVDDKLFQKSGKRKPQILTDGAAGLDVECTMRSIAYDMAMRIPTAQKHSDEILVSLNASACPDWKLDNGSKRSFSFNAGADNDDEYEEKKRDEKVTGCPCDANTVYVDCERGNDSNDGTCMDRPLRTIPHAQEVVRRLRRKASAEDDEIINIFIREGICYLDKTFMLTESNTYWRPFANETGPVFSGGAHLSNLSWSKFTDDVLVATLPPNVNASAVDGLFAFHRRQRHDDDSGGNLQRDLITSQIRLVRARYPNGNSEEDRMPTNYDKLGGGVSSVESWRAAGNVSVRFPGIEKNSSFYPWFGHSRDIRWVQDFHLENASSFYSAGQQHWQAPIGTAVRYQYKTGEDDRKDKKLPAVLSWSGVNAILHVIHYR
jgi:hypothetical protein